MSAKLLFLLISLTCFSFFVRIYRISEPNHKYFDEVYHVVTAEAYARNDPAAYDPFSPPPEEGTAYDWLHPPLAKLIQAISINILGDNPFAWRLPSVLFGTGIVLATFFLAYFLFGTKVAIFSSIVIAFENLNLVMSRITMNDVFVTFFILISFMFAHLYIRSASRHPELDPESRFWIRFTPQNDRTRRDLYLIFTALFLGFSVASKWTGVYAVAVVGAYIFFAQIKSILINKTHHGAVGGILKLSLLIIIPALIYLASYGQYWLQGHSWKQFMDLHKQIWAYQNRHDLEHPYGTTPIYCVPKGLSGPKTFCPWILDLRPVYYSYEQYGVDKAGYIYALGNPFIFWAGFAAVCYLTFGAMKKRSLKLGFIMLAYFVFWVPWIFAPRIMFLSHYLPSIPFLAISIGIILNRFYQSGYKYVAFSIVALFIFAFFYFYPITSGYPINVAKIDKFMWIESWR